MFLCNGHVGPAGWKTGVRICGGNCFHLSGDDVVGRNAFMIGDPLLAIIKSLYTDARMPLFVSNLKPLSNHVVQHVFMFISSTPMRATASTIWAAHFLLGC